MSTIGDTTQETREQLNSDRRNFLGMVRRMAVKLTSDVKWQLLGVTLLDGRTKEAVSVEVFPGIGFYARPSAKSNAEAAVVYAGGPQNPMVVATRDEDTRKKVAAIDQDETMAFNTTTVMYVRKNGTVEIRAAGGEATKLPTFNDLNLVANRLNNHIATYNSHQHPVIGATATITTQLDATAPPPLQGTDVLKAQ